MNLCASDEECLMGLLVITISVLDHIITTCYGMAIVIVVILSIKAIKSLREALSLLH